MRLLAIEQIITDANMIFISFSIMYHTLTVIHFRNQERFCQIIELFLVYAFVQTTVDDVNITKAKSHD